MPNTTKPSAGTTTRRKVVVKPTKGKAKFQASAKAVTAAIRLRQSKADSAAAAAAANPRAQAGLASVTLSFYNGGDEALEDGEVAVGSKSTPLPTLLREQSASVDTTVPGTLVQGRVTFGTDVHATFEVDLAKHTVVIHEEAAAGEKRLWYGTTEPTGRLMHHVTLHLVKVTSRAYQRGQRDLQEHGFLEVTEQEVQKNSSAHNVSNHALRFGPYEFPEEDPKVGLVQRTTNSAFCFSGGGARAYTASWGQFRAMHQLQMFDKIRYLSCVSGGNWACSVLVFRDKALADDDDFFGEFLYDGGNRGALTDARLEEMAGHCMGRAACGDQDQSFSSRLFVNYLNATGGCAADFWNCTIAERFLRPYGVASERIMSWSQSTVEDVISRNPHLKQDDFQKQNYRTPLLVVNSLLMSPLSRLPIPVKSFPQQFHVFESTPLACGIPIPSTTVRYDTCQGILTGMFSRASLTKELAVAGGMVETVGHNGHFLFDDHHTGTRQGDTVQLQRCYTVRDAVGTSSTCYAGYTAETRMLSTLCPRHKYEPIVKEGALPDHILNDEDEFHGRDWAFGDAGLADNFGLISMLRRKVENIVVFINTCIPLSCTKWGAKKQSSITKQMLDNAEVEPPRDASGELMIDNTLTGFFGWATPSEAAGITENLQCFNRKDFWPVVDQLQKAAESHRPVVAHIDDIDVVGNAFHGVRPYDRRKGERCNVTFVYLAKKHIGGKGADGARNAGFNEYMGDDTYAHYRRADSKFSNFPNYATAGQDATITIPPGLPLSYKMVGFDVHEVNLLAEYTSWSLYTWFTTDPTGRLVYRRVTGRSLPLDD